MIEWRHPAVSLLAVGLLAACGGEEQARTQVAAADADVVMMMPLTTSSEEARQHFLLGQRALDMGRTVEANQHFQKALETDPGFAYAYLNIANTGNSLDEFRANLQRAVELAGAVSEEERLLIGIAQKGFENDLEGQRQLAQQLVEIQPRSPRAWLDLATVQSALGQEEEARASMSKAAEISPAFAPAYMALGNSYLFNEPRDLRKAEENMQKVVALEPGRDRPHHQFDGARFVGARR